VEPEAQQLPDAEPAWPVEAAAAAVAAAEVLAWQVAAAWLEAAWLAAASMVAVKTTYSPLSAQLLP